MCNAPFCSIKGSLLDTIIYSNLVFNGYIRPNFLYGCCFNLQCLIVFWAFLIFSDYIMIYKYWWFCYRFIYFSTSPCRYTRSRYIRPFHIFSPIKYLNVTPACKHLLQKAATTTNERKEYHKLATFCIRVEHITRILFK